MNREQATEIVLLLHPGRTAIEPEVFSAWWNSVLDRCEYDTALVVAARTLREMDFPTPAGFNERLRAYLRKPEFFTAEPDVERKSTSWVADQLAPARAKLRGGTW